MRADNGSMGEGELRPRLKRCAESLSSQRAHQGLSPDNDSEKGCTARGSTGAGNSHVGSREFTHRSSHCQYVQSGPQSRHLFRTAYIRTARRSHTASVVPVKRVFASVESCRRGTYVGRFHPITTPQMPGTRAANGRFTSKRISSLPPDQRRLADPTPTRRKDQSSDRHKGRFIKMAPKHACAVENSFGDTTRAGATMLELAIDLSRSLATTRIPADAFCLLADLLDFVPLHANGLPGPDVQRIGHLFKGDRVADAAYLKFSGTNHSPYQQFFDGGPAGRQRVQEARDAIAAFKKIVSKPRSRRAFHERPVIEQSWEHVAQLPYYETVLGMVMHEFPSTVCANGRRIFGWSALTLFPAFQVGPMRTRSGAPDACKRTFIAFIRINVFAWLLALQAAPSIPGDSVEGEVAAVGSGIRLGRARELRLEDDNAPHGTQLGLFASKSLVCSEHRQALPVYGFCGPPLDDSDLAQLSRTMRVWSVISARVPLSDGDRPAWLFGPAARVNCSQDTAAQNVVMEEVMPEGRLFCLTLAANIVPGAELLWDYGYRPQY